MMPAVHFERFFPDTLTPEDACVRIEAEIAVLKFPKKKGSAQIYQRLLRNVVAGYIAEARGARSQTKKWRSIAEAMFWWSAAFSTSSDTPYCQPAGADANRQLARERAIEAQRIRRSGHPETGASWKNQEDCVRYLQGIGLGPGNKRVHSRGAILRALAAKVEV